MNTHMTKLKWVATLALILAAQSTWAQETTSTDPALLPAERSLSLELFGAHNTVGINYDRRFNGSDGLGCIAAPLEINYLLGRGRHHLELGFGASLGFYWEKVRASGYFVPYGNYEYGKYDIYYKRRTFGYFMFGNVGYRLQTRRGFQFRVGITPSVNFGDRYCLQREWLYPYLSLGWRLK